MQITTVTSLTLEFEGTGQLSPWLGPAIRGLVLRRFKNRFCIQPESERASSWRYCTGCPHLGECDYGTIFEPPHDSRLLIPSPAFPVPGTAYPGLLVPLRLTAIGPRAAERLPLIAEILADVGNSWGLEAERVPFILRGLKDPPVCQELHPYDLPPTSRSIPGRLPRVGVGLTAPLGLRTRKDAGVGGRIANLRPSFGELFRISYSVIKAAFASQNEMLSADMEDLQQSANNVEIADHCYEPFSQERNSGRSQQSWEFQGVTGGAVFRDVPMSLLPWMYWGGQFHVGNHRSSGAGSWRLVLD